MLRTGFYTLVLARYGSSIELITLSSSGLGGEMSFAPVCQLSSETLCRTLSEAGLDADAVLAKETAEGVHLLARPQTPETGGRTSRGRSQVPTADLFSYTQLLGLDNI